MHGGCRGPTSYMDDGQSPGMLNILVSAGECHTMKNCSVAKYQHPTKKQQQGEAHFLMTGALCKGQQSTHSDYGKTSPLLAPNGWKKEDVSLDKWGTLPVLVRSSLSWDRMLATYILSLACCAHLGLSWMQLGKTSLSREVNYRGVPGAGGVGVRPCQ